MSDELPGHPDGDESGNMKPWTDFCDGDNREEQKEHPCYRVAPIPAHIEEDDQKQWRGDIDTRLADITGKARRDGPERRKCTDLNGRSRKDEIEQVGGVGGG